MLCFLLGILSDYIFLWLLGLMVCNILFMREGVLYEILVWLKKKIKRKVNILNFLEFGYI